MFGVRRTLLQKNKGDVHFAHSMESGFSLTLPPDQGQLSVLALFAFLGILTIFGYSVEFLAIS